MSEQTDTPRTDEAAWPETGLVEGHFARELERELNAVTEQRDELLQYNEAFRKETLICADCDSISKEEYDQAIEQRDRLAEAMHKVVTSWDEATWLDEIDFESFREALQSLNQNTERTCADE